jgi:long-chain acyl-CoA synthetase
MHLEKKDVTNRLQVDITILLVSCTPVAAPAVPKVLYSQMATSSLPVSFLLLQERTHCSNVFAYIPVGSVKEHMGYLIDKHDIFIAYLPLAHVLEFVNEVTWMYVGVPIGYGSPKTLSDSSVRNCAGDIRELKPTIMIGVPSVWEMIKKGIEGKVREGGKEGAFKTAMGVKKNKILNLLIGGVMDAVVFKKVKDATGGRLKWPMSGGAALSMETQEFIDISLAKARFVQGYGMTESCG